MNKDILLKVFSLGIDYGQLLMEEEKENEETFDAFMGCQSNKKYNVPCHPQERRQLHSEKWFKAKRGSFEEFMEIVVKSLNKENDNNKKSNQNT